MLRSLHCRACAYTSIHQRLWNLRFERVKSGVLRHHHTTEFRAQRKPETPSKRQGSTTHDTDHSITMPTAMEEQVAVPVLTDLPEALVLRILEHVTASDLATLQQASSWIVTMWPALLS